MNELKKGIVKHKNNAIKILIVSIIMVIIFVLLFPTFLVLSYTNKSNFYVLNIDKEEVIKVSSFDNYPLFKNAEYIDNRSSSNIILENSDFINEDLISDIDTKINELLYLKYPMFIIDTFKSDTTLKRFVFENDKLVLEFLNHGYEAYPLDNKLNIYYNDIKDFLNIEVNIITDYQNEDGFVYNPDKQTVALTYDDGPHPVHTEDILKLLTDNKARATFFSLGDSINKYPSELIKIHESGNEVAMHGYSHTSFKRMNGDEVVAEINNTNNMIFNLTGEYAKYIRPPYGSINTKVKEVINMPIINWNLDPFDWKNKDSEFIANHILENVKAGDIILLHDIFETSKIATEKILQELYLRGFQVVDITTLANVSNTVLNTNTVYYDFN